MFIYDISIGSVSIVVTLLSFRGNQGALEIGILPERGTKIIANQVPTNKSEFQTPYEENNTTIIDKLALDMDDFYMLVDPSIKEHNSVVLNTSQERMESTVCHGQDSNVLCCKFNISVSVNNTSVPPLNFYTYHLVAFNGVRTYSGLYYGGVETCGVVACLNESIASCGQRFSNYSQIAWPVLFNSISILGTFVTSDQRVQYPTTLLSSIRPLHVKEYTWGRQNVGSTVIRNITLSKPQNRLLTFGIFGRDYDRDWDPIRNNTPSNEGSKIFYSTFLILVTHMMLQLAYST